MNIKIVYFFVLISIVLLVGCRPATPKKSGQGTPENFIEKFITATLMNDENAYLECHLPGTRRECVLLELKMSQKLFEFYESLTSKFGDDAYQVFNESYAGGWSSYRVEILVGVSMKDLPALLKKIEVWTEMDTARVKVYPLVGDALTFRLKKTNGVWYYSTKSSWPDDPIKRDIGAYQAALDHINDPDVTIDDLKRIHNHPIV
ncbi:MAG: hypothetical protein JEZ07_15465 [Phycisphaerae bacterium]|nr:hypothetical protein [Phycisphaerae bacterium]